MNLLLLYEYMRLPIKRKLGEAMQWINLLYNNVCVIRRGFSLSVQISSTNYWRGDCRPATPVGYAYNRGSESLNSRPLPHSMQVRRVHFNIH